QFLRHIERTKVLIHLVDVSGASSRDPVNDLETIRRELELYNPELLEKPHLVAANKMDAVDDPKRVTSLEKRVKTLKLPFFRISGVAGDGIKELLEAAWPHIAVARQLEANDAPLDDDDDDGEEQQEDYNPALVPPLRRKPPKPKHK
ncbi:MAG TPA: hypothetical protein VFP85_17090, partial [Vicinamibacterales bacterium]|nr:hypothetical protein [Vicinamibacterales bacterium]